MVEETLMGGGYSVAHSIFTLSEDCVAKQHWEDTHRFHRRRCVVTGRQGFVLMQPVI